MSSIKKGLREHIAAISGVAAITSYVRIDRLSQNDGLPNVVIQRDSRDNNETLETVADDSLVMEDIRISVRGKTSEQAETLARLIADNLRALSGNVGSTRKVSGCNDVQESDEHEPDDFGGDAGNGLVTITTTIIHVPQ